MKLTIRIKDPPMFSKGYYLLVIRRCMLVLSLTGLKVLETSHRT